MEIVKPLDLLNSDGCLAQDGWARHQLFRYDRRLVARPGILLKEWNRFLAMDGSGHWIVLADANQMGGRLNYSILYADLSNGLLLKESRRLRAKEDTRLPLSSNEDDEISFSCEEMRTAFIRRGNVDNVMLSAPLFRIPNCGMGLDARFEFSHNPDSQSFTYAIHLSKSRRSFLLNALETCIPVSGVLRRGDSSAFLSEADGIMGIFDWGRGRFSTFSTTKAVFCGKVGESSVGICIVRPGTLALTVDGTVSVFEGISIRTSKNGFSARSKDSKIECALKTTISDIDHGTTRLFGRLQGNIMLDDGRTLGLDGLPGMCYIAVKNSRTAANGSSPEN